MAGYEPDFYDEGPGGFDLRAFCRTALDAKEPVRLSVTVPAGVARFLALKGIIAASGGYTPQAHDLVLGFASDQDPVFCELAQGGLAGLCREAVGTLRELEQWPELVTMIEQERANDQQGRGVQWTQI